jgi:hypothetical protein
MSGGIIRIVWILAEHVNNHYMNQTAMNPNVGHHLSPALIGRSSLSPEFSILRRESDLACPTMIAKLVASEVDVEQNRVGNFVSRPNTIRTFVGVNISEIDSRGVVIPVMVDDCLSNTC